MTPSQQPLRRDSVQRRKSLAEQAADCQEVQRRLKEEAAQRRKSSTPAARRAPASR